MVEGVRNITIRSLEKPLALAVRISWSWPRLCLLLILWHFWLSAFFIGSHLSANFHCIIVSMAWEWTVVIWVFLGTFGFWFGPIMTIVIFTPNFDEFPLLAIHLSPQLWDHSLLFPQDLIITRRFLRDGLDHLLMTERWCWKRQKEKNVLRLGTSDWIVIYCARDREDSGASSWGSWEAGTSQLSRKIIIKAD